MAHDPIKKAKCVLDLVSGVGVTEASKKHKVPHATVKEWLKEIQAAQDNQGVTSLQARKDLFLETYTRFGITTMEMFIGLGEVILDPDFLKGKTTEDVIAHATFVRDSFMSFERMHSGLPAAALEARTEVVIGEPVEDGP